MLPFPIISNTNILPIKAGIKMIHTVGVGHFFLTDSGNLYGCGAFSGYGTTPGSLVVNYPGNNPSNSTYTLLDLPIT